MNKEALVERLITAERTLAEQRERWLSQQDEALTWRLRAETAERHLQDVKKPQMSDQKNVHDKEYPSSSSSNGK